MSIKKIVILNSSPRKEGNSALLAREAANAIMEQGVEVESFYLHNLNIQYCRACEACRKGKTGDQYCIIKDDMEMLFKKLLEADAFLIAAPIYWFTVPAQLKVVMDRWYALGGPSGYALKGRPAGIILVYGDEDPFASGAVNAVHTLKDAFHYIGVPIAGIVHGSAYGAGEITKNKTLMEKAAKLGKKMASM